MTLKLRLALTFFLLSAVPLSGIAFYSYATSRAALREAAELEAELMAREMETRVASVASGVGRRLERLRDLPAGAWANAEDASEATTLPAEVLASLAEAAPYFEDLRFVPEPPTAEEPPDPLSAAETPAGISARSASRSAPAPAARTSGAVLPPLPRIVIRTWSDGDQQALHRELESVRREVARALAQTSRARAAAERNGADLHTRAALREVERRAATELAHLAGTGLAPPAAAVPAIAASPAEQVLKGEYSCPIEENGKVVGTVTARIRARELLQAVLAETHAEQGEIPFAIDAGDQLYAANTEHAARLAGLPWLKEATAKGGRGVKAVGDWVVVARRDPGSGMRYGIARPISEALAALGRATARNFGFGLGLVAIALAGIFPLAERMTRNLAMLNDGASRLAAGDLDARVPVRSRDEIGRLATTFNRMAEQLRANQQQLLAQEKLRKEEEIARCLLAAENERKGRELEEARQFQLSLLPRELPPVAGLELAVSMHTATEVGGDYYDGQSLADGDVTLAIGDATGHGAASATMVTVVKSLFICEAGAAAPAAFLGRANAQIQRMALGRMAMALSIVRARGRRLTLSAAGMPPALWLHAATGEVDEITLTGLPLGSMPGATYQEVEVELAVGDHLLLMSDGFPELQSPTGEPLGYEAARAHFAAAVRRLGDEPSGAGAVLAALRDAAERWTAGGAPSDDMTFLLVRAA